MTVRIYKETYFEAAHRLMHYEGKCYRLHGHQWRVEFWVDGTTSKDSQILVDFNLIKNIVNRYDHQIILNEEDPMVDCLKKFQEVVTTKGDPTSENLAGAFRPANRIRTDICIQTLQLESQAGFIVI